MASEQEESNEEEEESRKTSRYVLMAFFFSALASSVVRSASSNKKVLREISLGKVRRTWVDEKEAKVKSVRETRWNLVRRELTLSASMSFSRRVSLEARALIR